jgi:hypothetical protein
MVIGIALISNRDRSDMGPRQRAQKKRLELMQAKREEGSMTPWVVDLQQLGEKL